MVQTETDRKRGDSWRIETERERESEGERA